MSLTLHRTRGGSQTTEANRPTMKMSFSVELPRERASVPLVRHLATHSLRQLGVVQDVVDDIEIALSEACTNVIDHADIGDSYEVEMLVKGDECEIRVLDRGPGFDAVPESRTGSNAELERGRGLEIVHAVMDQVALESQTDQGTLVTLEKHLDFSPQFESF